MQMINQILSLDFPAQLPSNLLVIEQRFDAPQIHDLAATVNEEMRASRLLKRVHSGYTIALGIGSRGITNLPEIVRAVVECLRSAGTHPFLFPAMGSHGGATPEGQLAMLAELGITPESVQAEIRATMEVVQIGVLPGGPPLFQDKYAASADATILINRIKPHTDFHSEIESGLAKMAVIGLGKRKGAEAMHAFGVEGFRKFLSPAARTYQAKTNLIGGLAILENAYGQSAEIAFLDVEQIGGPSEQNLLERARTLMARLPFDEIDALVLREIGKNISGTGMDTNVVGRLMIPRQPEDWGGVDVALIAVLDLSGPTQGNATGIGLANITTGRVAEKIDWIATYTNAVTSGINGMQRVSLPLTLPNDRQALQVAVRCCGQPPQMARLVFIRNTSRIGTLWVSPNMRPLVEAQEQLAIVGEVPLAFSDDGAMQSPWELK